MIRLFSYGPFRPFSYLSSVEYFQYTPSSKVETASKNPHNKIREPFQNSFLVSKANLLLFSKYIIFALLKNYNMKILQLILPLCLVSVAAGCKDNTRLMLVASNSPYTCLYSYDKKKGELEASDFVVRGSQIKVYENEIISVGDSTYTQVQSARSHKYYINTRNITADSSAVVMEKRLFARSSVSIISDTATSKINGLLHKGASVQVEGADWPDNKGEVHRYKIRCASGQGYVYAKYLTKSKESALARHKPEVYDSLHLAVRNSFGGGKAYDCDFYPYEKPTFEDNVMPRSCYSLYINFAPGNIANIESYIALAKKTKINTFVIDIKDNECPGFKAEAMKRFSPTNYARASSRGEELYRNAVKRLHEEGFYVVGRITCFKDTYFVKDNPQSAITEKATGKPYLHNKSYWPSAYNRKVWQFNVELAKEAVEKFGFNEINFDYVRFPDRMTRIEDLVDYHNKYNESKVQAIQRFVMYACDEIHAKGAYVSIDVFGESANPGYTTAYGQYWPALSNVADVMCGMPYPDHFPDGFYGIKKPWNHPYELLYQWGLRVKGRQAATPVPAKVRTWIQAYHVMRHVDPNGIDYNAENIEKEIRGLFAAGLCDGYITWLSSSSLKRYKEQAPAFNIDYLKEYSD